MTRNNPIFEWLLAACFLGMLLLAMTGCITTVPIATGSHEQTHDSIRTEYVRDSVYIDRWHKEFVKGDTVYVHDSIDRWRDKYMYIHDSIDNSRVDSIPVIIEVEKKGAAFWKGSGIAFWILIGILVLGIAIGLIIKFAK